MQVQSVELATELWVSVQRVRRAQTILSAPVSAPNLTFVNSLSSTSASLQALNSSLLEAVVAELTMDVRMVHFAANSSAAERVANFLHGMIHNTSTLLRSIADLLPVDSVGANELRVEYGGHSFNLTDENGMPQLPVSSIEGLGSAPSEMSTLDPGTVETISTAVTRVVAAALGTSVAISVGAAVGGAAAGAAATGAAGAAGGECAEEDEGTLRVSARGVGQAGAHPTRDRRDGHGLAKGRSGEGGGRNPTRTRTLHV